ncbi:MAG: hypothetical protein WBF69_10980 [Castellaniella sp.]
MVFIGGGRGSGRLEVPGGALWVRVSLLSVTVPDELEYENDSQLI